MASGQGDPDAPTSVSGHRGFCSASHLGGYWAKRAAGKPTKQIHLHNTADPQQEHIVVHVSRDNLAPAVREVLDQERERRKLKRRVAPSDQLEPPMLSQNGHAAIGATPRAIRKAKPNADGVVRADGQAHCGIEVGFESVDRSIAILDAVAHALDARGLKTEPVGNAVRITLEADSLTFSLAERVERRRHEPTMEQLSREERFRKKAERDGRLKIWSFGRERVYPEFDFIRTGELSIQIADQYVRGLRRTWGDGKRQRVERLVDEIVSGITAYLTGVVARRENERNGTVNGNDADDWQN